MEKNKKDLTKTKQKGNKNEGKNAPVAPGVPFTSDRQPSPDAKKAGWNRRQQAQEMMDKVREYMKLPYAEFDKLLKDIAQNPDKYSVQDVMLSKYATKAFNGEKFMLDWFDRNISKAPVEVSGTDGEPIQVALNIFTNARKTVDRETGSGQDKVLEGESK